MNLKKIKTVIIIVLAIVNIFLVYNIVSDMRTENYIDEESVKNTIEILARYNINISLSDIPKKKPQAYVYECSSFDEYGKNVAKLISNSDTEKIFSVPNGTRFITTDNSVIELGDSFGIEYTSGQIQDTALFEDLIAKASQNSENGKTLPDKTVLKNIEKMLGGESVTGNPYNKIKKISFELSFSDYDAESDTYIIKYKQKIGDMNIFGNDIYFAVKNGDILYISGQWCFLTINKQYSSHLYDQINILFIEKENILAAKESAENSNEKEYNIVGLNLGYCTYFNEDKTGFYFVPAWQILYDENTSSVYNAANGEQYLQTLK